MTGKPYSDSGTRDSQPFHRGPDLERLSIRIHTSTREMRGQPYQEETVDKGNSPQMERIPNTAELDIESAIGVLTYENGMGVVRIRSKPVNASTRAAKAFISPAMASC